MCSNQVHFWKKGKEFLCSVVALRNKENLNQQARKKKGYWNWPGKLQSVHLYIILATFIIQLHAILYWHLVALRWAYICFSLSLFFFLHSPSLHTLSSDNCMVGI